MERKTLFTPSREKIHVNVAVVLPLERSSKEPVLRETHLFPNEELQSLLYVGCSDSTLHVYRVVARLDREEVHHDVSTVFLHRKVLASLYGGGMKSGGDGVGGGGKDDKSANADGVTFLDVNRKSSTPQLLVLANGTLDVLHYGNLNSMGIFQHLPLPPGPAAACCVARAQGDELLPLQEKQQQQEQRLALLIKRWIVLVGYTERRAYIIGSGSEDGVVSAAAAAAATVECPHIVVPDGTQVMVWQGDSIITGSSREYSVFDANTRQLRQRMVVDGVLSQGPLCRYVNGQSEGSYVLIRKGDCRLALFDATIETDLEAATPVMMSGPVVDVAWAPPFLIGVKKDGGVLMQSWLDNEDFPSSSASVSSSPSSSSFGFVGVPFHVHSTPLGVYGVCAHSVQFLVLMPRKTVRALYINAGLYERALRYSDHAFDAEDDAQLRRVYYACAHHALMGKRYTEAFRYFNLAATPTAELLAFVPELQRPKKDTQRLDGRVTLSFSSGEAYRRLYELLLQRRSVGLGSGTEEQRATEFAIFLLYVLECVPYTDKELTDMFLFSSTLAPDECLRYVGEDGVRPKPMIVPLVLASDGRFTEALERCQLQRLVYEAAVVLQMSGDEQLYLRYMPWMLSVDTNAALVAVVRPQRRPPPVSLILPMLLGYGGYPLHEYLHYLIFVDNNTEPRLHTLYATNLIDIIRTLQPFGVEGMKASIIKVVAGEESGIRGAARRALLTFLQLSSHYEANVVLSFLVDAGLVEEQVLALEQAGDHLGALTKLVYELDDVSAAARYCEVQHARDLQRVGNRVHCPTEGSGSNAHGPQTLCSKQREELLTDRDDTVHLAGQTYAFQGSRTSNEYFNLLLHVLLVPPAGKQRQLSAALAVLNEHSHCINPLSVMTSLPSEVCVAEISSYMRRAFQTLCSQVQMAEVNANVAASMVADAQRYHSLLRQRCVYVDEKRPCSVCGKPLGLGVIAAFPNLKATHFRCFRTQELDPERGVPFRPAL
ncbi:hypothetical protein DQ04_05531040 [Trypanosoma grayi]|uniref:hypothetical protein n=1 Tax=Trypanosoma grayi TaxID=71804 RepID=UPI0004F47D95|nr:hypothetical protein DQ04_05531040 [Trypanosoma grayi]KEG09255.1 hypothetical protein DQ04_05531040 [Trypanosoma grayi]